MGHCLQTEFNSLFLMTNQNQPFDVSWYMEEYALHFAWAFQWQGIYSSNFLTDVLNEAGTENCLRSFLKPSKSILISAFMENKCIRRIKLGGSYMVQDFSALLY